MRRAFFLTLLAVAPSALSSQAAPVTAPVFTHADTLRGSNTPERAWWDAAFYDLHVRVNPADSSISRLQRRSRIACLTTRARDADRSAAAARRRQHRPGRNASSALGATATRSSCDSLAPQTVGAKKKISVYYHGKPSRRHASALGRRIRLGARQPRPRLDRHRERGTRRQRLVAEQGHPRRRARQPARRDHRSRLDARCLERPAAQHDTRTATARPRTSGSSSTRSTTTTSR